MEAVDPLSHVSSIRDFRFGRLIGKGAFGNVYLASLRKHITSKFDDEEEEYFAVKIIKKSMIKSPKLVIRMKNEIRIHQSVGHENIVKLLKVFQDKKNFYLVMEYCEKGELFRYLKKKKKLSSEESRIFFSQIAKAVNYLHCKGIIHRDLKLSNIFLTKNRIIKIGDFGLSTRLSSSDERRMTQLGTPDYVAPEILKKRPHGFEVDLWSMGCILYAFFVGHPPFHSHDIRKTLFKIRRNEFRIRPEHNVPKDAQELIFSLLHPDESHRISIEEVCKHPFIVPRRNFFSLLKEEVQEEDGDGGRTSRYIRGRCGGVVRIVKKEASNHTSSQKNFQHRPYPSNGQKRRIRDVNTMKPTVKDIPKKNILHTRKKMIGNRNVEDERRRKVGDIARIKQQQKEQLFDFEPICLDRLKTPYIHKTKNGCVEIRKECVIFRYRKTKFLVFPQQKMVRVVTNNQQNLQRSGKNTVIVREYMPISALPKRYWKYYRYVSEFVGLVRSRTVKLRIIVRNVGEGGNDRNYSPDDDRNVRVKCCVMENSPPDIECDFGEDLGRATFVAREGKVVLGGQNLEGLKEEEKGKVNRMVLFWKDKAMNILKQVESRGRRDFPFTIVLRVSRNGECSTRRQNYHEKRLRNDEFGENEDSDSSSTTTTTTTTTTNSIMSVHSAPGAVKSFDSKVMAKYLTRTDSTSLEMKRLYSI